MTPGARVQAAIEILDEVIAAARSAGPAADTIIARYFKTRRYAGSKDRRAVRELVYRAIRRSGDVPASGRAAMLGVAEDEPELRGLFDGSPHAPAAADAQDEAAPRSPLPSWIEPLLDRAVERRHEIAALLDRAPLDLRVNSLKSERGEVLAKLEGAEPTPLSPMGVRLPQGYAVEQHPLWIEGHVEVQDEGSQLLALSCAAEPGMTVLDLCAGAGGKTLALAAEMANRGRIIASDTDRARLSRMRPRLERAGIGIVEQRLLDPGREKEALADLSGGLDLVLVDAPCSGSGTWRRNPETRWRLTPQRLERLVMLQAHLLDVAAELVRPGGALVYAVCSLLEQEGRAQAEAFGARHSAFVPESPIIEGGRPSGPGRLLTPAHDGTDGFFVARWRAPC
ncbi:MAG TPA: RsmB/NOP family class I SAM-dependent RNA methyltransferase [Allosphingosinicella sp.]|nr:RsmB/NOP family class I SAM-dependent RNA methyltransferase [Allosphingosinicella sp.]